MIASSEPQPDRFILLAGAAFSGKTTAAISFPKPLILNFDNKITAKGIDTIPFHDDKFVDSIRPRANAKNPANRRDAFHAWLQNNVNRLADYTVIIDSLTSLETAFHQQTFDVEEKWGVNGGLYFGAKLSYFLTAFALLAASNARIIVNCHLMPIYVRDEKTGGDVPTGKTKASVTGSTAERLPTYCTSIIYSYVKSDTIRGTMSFHWVLRPCPAFDARTIAKNVPPSGEIDVTAGAYEAFKKCF